ncbi:MAG: filamentous hemagglutinin family protein, partial [Myxococcota bacterium]
MRCSLRDDAMRTLHIVGTAWLVGWVTVGVPLAAMAAPIGERIVDGTAIFERNGNYTTITASDGAIIHYDSFDIDHGETVEFIQPDSDSAVLNRIFGDPTIIMGMLRSNGRVYLLNSAGLYFGGTAVVDVGGLYAVAGSMSNHDFLNNIDRFTQLTGTVENWGEVRGEVVGLIGQFVANHGSIVSGSGLVAMVAGGEVAIGHMGGNIMVTVGADFPDASITGPGVENTGIIDAGEGRVILAAGDVYSLAVRHPGITRARNIALEAGSEGRVHVSGTLDASGLEEGGTGGTIHLLGHEVVLENATINASGSAGGGEVLVGGDYLGGGDIRTAAHTYVSSGSTIDARATDNGDGGKVILWSDEMTLFYGSIDARGGDNGGNGGFIETSSKNQLIVGEAHVDASAAMGESGLWLLDPRNVSIEAIGGAAPHGTFVGGVFTPDNSTP